MSDVALTRPTHIYHRGNTFPTGVSASSPVEFRVRDDDVDGLHYPARAALIANDSAANTMTFRISPDGQKWSSDITIPVASQVRIRYDDGVDIAMVLAWGTAGQAYRITACPGRSTEPAIEIKPRKVSGAKITGKNNLT